MRTAAAIVDTAGLALLAAACGGSKVGHVAARQNAAIAFSRCMRSHGLSKFPDPGSGGQIPKTPLPQLGASLSQFVAAKRACVHVLPSGGQPGPAVSQQLLSKLVKFAQCMRSHGVSNWPDLERVPSTAPPEGSPYQFDLQGGLNGRSFSPQITSAMHECLHREHLADVAWT
jgi:hypothetical protein